MIRIEKTQINGSAFLILCSSLSKVQSHKIVDREKNLFSINLDFLNKLLESLIGGDPACDVYDLE
jgi:hypothetical protein